MKMNLDDLPSPPSPAWIALEVLAVMFVVLSLLTLLAAGIQTGYVSRGRLWLIRSAGGVAWIRIYAVCCVVWILMVAAWLIIVEPFSERYRLRDADWMLLVKVTFVPPILLFVVFCAVAWAVQRNKSSI